MIEREELIREISDKHNMKGYSHSPLEREKINEFIHRLGDLQRKQRSEYEKLQSDIRAKNDEFNRKSRQLHTELESLKMQRSNTREQIVGLIVTSAGGGSLTLVCLYALERETCGDIEGGIDGRDDARTGFGAPDTSWGH